MTYVVGVFIVVVGVCVALLMQRVLEVSNELVALRKEVELLKQVTRDCLPRTVGYGADGKVAILTNSGAVDVFVKRPAFYAPATMITYTVPKKDTEDLYRRIKDWEKNQ